MVDYNKSPLATGVPVSGWDPTGQSTHYNPDGTVSEGYAVNPDGSMSTGTYDADVDRLRAHGAQFSDTPWFDARQADQSRGVQMGALGLLHAQADGSAASSAQIMAQRANQNAAQQTAAAVMSSKGGPGAHIASFNAAAPMAAQQAMAANAQNADARAAEISRGQGQYAGGATGMSQQDIAQATTKAQLEQQQRALNEQHQQTNEALAWQTRNQAMQNAGAYTDLERNNINSQHQREDASNQQKNSAIVGGVNTVVGGVTGGVGAYKGSGTTGSDERMKRNVHPIVGSLSRFASREE